MAIAKALLAAGAELNAKNDGGQTPLDVAKLNKEVGGLCKAAFQEEGYRRLQVGD